MKIPNYAKQLEKRANLSACDLYRLLRRNPKMMKDFFYQENEEIKRKLPPKRFIKLEKMFS